MKKRVFGELELQILQTFKKGERLTVKDVHRLLGGEGSYNTIMTVMNRLVQKKQLVRDKIGLQYEYWLLDTSSSSLFSKIKQMCSSIGMKALVAHLIEEEDVSDAELEAMEKLIQQKRKK